MANHRKTEHFFRRIEDTLATIFACDNKENFGLAPPPGKTAATLCNDLSIGLVAFRQCKWASVKITQADAAAFTASWVFRHCPRRNVVYIAARKRVRYTNDYAPPLKSTQVTVTNDDNETQLALRIDVNTPLGRKLILAAATLFNSSYLPSAVSFLGHVDRDLDIELRSVYPDVVVLNDTHPTYGNITMIL